MECTPKVLILEDDDLRYDLRRLLKNEGFDIRFARSVNHLLKLANDDHFDAGIIDIRLSKAGTEGFDAIRRLRDIKPNIYIEVLTAFENYKRQSLNLGADRVSIKPGGIDELAPRIRRGILEKQFKNLFYELGIEHIPIEEFNIENTCEMSARVASNVDFLSKFMSKINVLLDSLASNSDFTEEGIEYVKKGIREVIIKQLGNSNKMDDYNGSFERVDSQLKKNKNYLSFVQSYQELKNKYPNMYVAFVNGSFYKANKDLSLLHDDIDKTHADEDAFIKKIATDESIISLSKPRKIMRNH